MYNIICFGEMLWDILPQKELPGGAPMNAAYHLQKHGQQVAVISKVGKDSYGERLLALLKDNGITTAYVQQDALQATGKVLAQPIGEHDVQFNILFPAAWDFIEWQPSLGPLLQQAQYLVFGSLAARNAVSRSTLEKALSWKIKKVLDINLRPPHYDPALIKMLLSNCDILKLNQAELELISSWLGAASAPEEQVGMLAHAYRIQTIVVTMGARGALLYMNGRFYSHPGFRVQVADTIGSGDAFLAGFLSSLIKGRSPEESLAIANATGALVASRSGGCPAYHVQEVSALLETV
ncbi:MAG TPA: carbohydrate kinase [Chitinophaga sp.]|uniref:carbohydrate kinase family protein n=1 Tax=Chitinophaga sp. TaxID=1869181 RepID=UPI002DB57FB6|nr:carbohydrate kinase [Chitinophaga sp.]HEU4554840.1 carbohydrate kinase [Chitinophaga sp.]